MYWGPFPQRVHNDKQDPTRNASRAGVQSSTCRQRFPDIAHTLSVATLLLLLLPPPLSRCCCCCTYVLLLPLLLPQLSGQSRHHVMAHGLSFVGHVQANNILTVRTYCHALGSKSITREPKLKSVSKHFGLHCSVALKEGLDRYGARARATAAPTPEVDTEARLFYSIIPPRKQAGREKMFQLKYRQ